MPGVAPSRDRRHRRGQQARRQAAQNRNFSSDRSSATRPLAEPDADPLAFAQQERHHLGPGQRRGLDTVADRVQLKEPAGEILVPE